MSVAQQNLLTQPANKSSGIVDAMAEVARVGNMRLMVLGIERNRLHIDTKDAADFITIANKEAETITRQGLHAVCRNTVSGREKTEALTLLTRIL